LSSLAHISPFVLSRTNHQYHSSVKTPPRPEQLCRNLSGTAEAIRGNGFVFASAVGSRPPMHSRVLSLFIMLLGTVAVQTMTPPHSSSETSGFGFRAKIRAMTFSSLGRLFQKPL
jgi:hypothetical protein